MKKFYVILCLTITSLTQLQAQAPQGFNYQANVRNSAGELMVNESVTFQFTIVQGSTTGTSLYVETHTVQTDDLAQVALVIGQGNTVSGDFSQIDWSLGSYYLTIDLDTGSGYVSMGTTQLLSVPYALYADTAGNVEALQTQIDALVLLTDADNDGYSENQGDCDDTNATVYPGATEDESDGIDNDCDGEIDETLGYEATFYYVHTGGGNVVPYGDLMSTTTTWYTGQSWSGTTDIDVVMQDLIDNGNGQSTSIGALMPTTGSFEFAGPITGNNCGQTWTYTPSTGQNFYYLAVPNNSSFPEDLTTGSNGNGFFQWSCNGLNAYASSRRQFTYNGESYWLYKLQSTTGTFGQTAGFK
jgi:hypothetical protein